MLLCCLLYLLTVLLKVSDGTFTFILHINSHTTHVNCDIGVSPECETYFSVFCLRGSISGRSTDTSDCPLGANNDIFNEDSGTIQIQSSMAWEENFQLFTEAVDSDPGFDDDIDDIFIEGSLRNSSLSSPMVFTGVNNRITMVVQFQRVCGMNFYGVDCLTECVASDNDVTGHYTCDSESGSRICLPGYTDPDNNCRENVDDCASGPCQNGGNCTDLVADFSCNCPEGYSGNNCSVNIDDCQEVHCPGNSTCLDSIGGFTCICNPGFTGQNCTPVLDPCDVGPCDNGGTCVSVDSFSSMCVCPAGYTGLVCELNINNCLNANCPPGTSCLDGNNTFQCVQQIQDRSEKSTGTANIIMIGSIVGVAVIIVLGCSIFVVVLIIVGMKKRNKKLTRRFSENEYMSSPTKSDEQEFNPLYGTADNSVSSTPTSPACSVHECENSLYNMADLRHHPIRADGEEMQNEGVIYEQPSVATTAMILTSPNRSYNSLDFSIQGGKELKNPLYGTGVSTPPPTYSVPRPSNSSLPQNPNDPLPEEYPGYDTPAATDESKGEVFYETIDNSSSHKDHQVDSESSPVEIVYEQLDHHPSCIKPTQLSDTDCRGYGQLEHS